MYPFGNTNRLPASRGRLLLQWSSEYYSIRNGGYSDDILHCRSNLEILRNNHFGYKTSSVYCVWVSFPGMKLSQPSSCFGENKIPDIHLRHSPKEAVWTPICSRCKPCHETLKPTERNCSPTHHAHIGTHYRALHVIST